MTDEELLSWYKSNSGTKPDDMSQQDYELNVNKALKLQQDEQLDTNLQNQQAAVAKAQSTSQQSANISNEKLMKYLNQSHLSSGLASGQTSSDFINANNSYVQQRASIANDAADQQTSLLEQYQADKLSNATDAYNNEVAIYDKYYDREQEEQAALDEKNATNDTYWQTQASARIGTMKDALLADDDYVDDDGNLTDEAINLLLEAAESYKDKFSDSIYYDLLIDEIYTDVYRTPTTSTSSSSNSSSSSKTLSSMLI